MLTKLFSNINHRKTASGQDELNAHKPLLSPCAFYLWFHVRCEHGFDKTWVVFQALHEPSGLQRSEPLCPTVTFPEWISAQMTHDAADRIKEIQTEALLLILLTHWGLYKMAAILQTNIFRCNFFRMKMLALFTEIPLRVSPKGSNWYEISIGSGNVW